MPARWYLVIVLLCVSPLIAHAQGGNLLLNADLALAGSEGTGAGTRIVGERWLVYREAFLKVQIENDDAFRAGRCLHIAGKKLGSEGERHSYNENQNDGAPTGGTWVGYQFDAVEPDTEYTFTVRARGRGSFRIQMAGLRGDHPMPYKASEAFTLTDEVRDYTFTWRVPDDPTVGTLRISLRPQAPEIDGWFGDFRLTAPTYLDTDPTQIVTQPAILTRTAAPALRWRISDTDGLTPERITLTVNGTRYAYPCPQLAWDGAVLTFNPVWPEIRYTTVLAVQDRNGNRYRRSDIFDFAREFGEKAPARGLPDLHLADPIRIAERTLDANASWHFRTAGGGDPLLQFVTVRGTPTIWTHREQGLPDFLSPQFGFNPVAATAPRVWTDANGDFSSAKTLAAFIIRKAGAHTEREKAFALWHWVAQNIPEGGGCCPATFIQYVNCDGGGCCGCFSYILTRLWAAAGLRCNTVGCPGHCVTTVWWGGKRHHFDAICRAYYPTRDGEEVASLADIKADPRLLLRNVRGDGLTAYEAGNTVDFMRLCFNWMDFPAVTKMEPMDNNAPDVLERASYDLRAGESFTLLGDNDGIWTRYRVGEPPDYANGVFLFEPNFDSLFWQAALITKNMRADVRGLHTSSTGTATLSYERKSPYLTPGAIVSAVIERRDPDARVALWLSPIVAGQPVETRPWYPVWELTGTGEQAVHIDLRPYLTVKGLHYGPKVEIYGYRLRFEITSQKPDAVTFRSLRILTYTQHHGPSVPRLALGENTIHYARDAQSGPVTVTLGWRETGGLRLSPAAPVEGEACTLSATISNRGQATAPGGVVRFWAGNNPKYAQKIGERTLPVLKPGRSTTVSVLWTAVPYPASVIESPALTMLSRGGHIYTRLWVRVDPDGAVAENDEFDNAAELHVRVRQLPDLVITPEHLNITLPDSPHTQLTCTPTYQGEANVSPLTGVTYTFTGPRPKTLRIRAIVRNCAQSRLWTYENGAPAQHVIVRCYDGEPEAGGRLIGERTIPRILPAEHGFVDFNWPTAGLSGTRRLCVTVDPENAIRESDDSVKSNRAVVNVEL